MKYKVIFLLLILLSIPVIYNVVHTENVEVNTDKKDLEVSFNYDKKAKSLYKYALNTLKCKNYEYEVTEDYDTFLILNYNDIKTHFSKNNMIAIYNEDDNIFNSFNSKLRIEDDDVYDSDKCQTNYDKLLISTINFDLLNKEDNKIEYEVTSLVYIDNTNKETKEVKYPFVIVKENNLWKVDYMVAIF